jgi:hypothetical protein
MRHGTNYAYRNRGCHCQVCSEWGMAHRRRGLPDGDPRHGTTNGYQNHGCRCQACCDANTEQARKLRHARHLRGLPDGDPRHGTSNGYVNFGCRCDDCRTVATADRQTSALRRRAKDAT